MRSRNSQAVQFWAKLAVGFFVVLLLMVWEHVQTQRLGGQLKDMHQEADRLAYENGRMQMQIHQWVSPSHLESMARKEYQMVPLDSGHIIGIEKS